MATIGSYKGVAIKSGTDAQVKAQVNAINAAQSKTTSSTSRSGGSYGSSGRIDPNTPRYNTSTGLLTDYGRSLGLKEVNQPKATVGTPRELVRQTEGVPESQIDTSQPSPSSAEISKPGLEPLTGQTYEVNPYTGQRLAPGETFTDYAGNTIKQGSPYVAAQQQLKGQVAPSDAGEAMLGVQQGLRGIPEQEDTSAIDTFVAGVPQIGQLMQGITELLNPQNQTTTLLQDYQALYKESGLDKINQEIIDADTIINGTEDDIRNEVQAAGGFATDSQVQAMSIARNKSLLKRYNQLVQMRTDATNQLNTLTQLNAQDKQMAQQRLNTQISAMFQLGNFAMQAQNNVREQYNSLLKNIGADGLYATYSKDPRQLGMIEQIIGGSRGWLQGAATQAIQQRARDEQMEALDIRAKEASIANIYSQMAERDAKKQLESLEKQKALDSQNRKLNETTQIVTGKVDDAIGMISPMTTGAGAYLSNIKGTRAFNLARTIDTIQANIGFDTLQAMRDASPTGGALGQVSEREIALLQSTISSLDTGQDALTLENNLNEVKEHYLTWLGTSDLPSLNKLGYTLSPDYELILITN